MSTRNDTDQEVELDRPHAASRRWAALCHLTAVMGWLLNLLLISLGQIGIPLATWWGKRQGMPLVDQDGREAVNFHVSVSLYAYAVVLLRCFSSLFPRPPEVLQHVPKGLIAAPCLVCLVAAARAWQGGHFRYPVTIRFI